MSSDGLLVTEEASFLTTAYLFLHCSEYFLSFSNQDMNGNKDHGLTHKMVEDLSRLHVIEALFLDHCLPIPPLQ